MSAANPDNRNSGIPSTGPLPWGSTFCQFYRTRKDLLDVLVPYFRAGLENNESCLWVTSGVLREADAEKALKKAVAGFGSRAAAGQVAIVPSSRWLARGGRSGRAILSRLDKAIGDGFDGLRLACEAVPAGNGATGLVPCGARVIAGKNVVAAFAYPASGFDALGIMDVIKDHRFALVRSAGRWEVIESSEARTARAAQRRSDEKLKSLFQNMSEGFAYHRILLDPRGRPCDFVFLQINDAFRRLTGLRAKDIIGKRATVAIPGLEKDPADWIGKYGKVAMTGEPVRFESYSEPLKRWYVVSAFSPHKGYFAVTFNDITERKLAEETVRLRTVTLDGINRVFRETMTSSTEEEFGRKCLAVAEKVTRSRSGFIAEIGPDGLLHDVAISDPGWSLCRMEDKGGHRRLPGTFEIRGLYGRVIREGKGFFTNDPASHPDSVGTPQGHPPLSAFLGVPMIHRGRTIGVVGVANREGGYRAEDLEALEALVAAISRSLMHRRAEEKIFETGQRLEGLMKALPVGVSFSDDVTCQRITGNPTALAQFEVGAEDNLSASAPDGSAAGRRLRYFDRGRTLSDTELPLQRAVSENRDIPPTELEVELPSGRRWSMEASAAPLRDRRGNVIGGVAVTLDISGRKRAEEALRRAKEDWEQTFNTVPDLIAILDSDHRIIRVNKAMADRLGVAPEQCIGKSCYDAVHRSGSPPAFCPHALTCRDGEERLAEVHEPRLGGDFVVSTTPMFGERGQVVGAVHVAREITERKRNEARLLSISRRFALLADTAGELLTAQEPQQAMEALCRRVMEHLDCQVFFNFLVDEKSGRLRLNACAGILEEEARAIEWMEYGTAICGCVAREGQCIVAQRIGDTPDPRTELVKSYGVRAYACHPLLGPAGKVLGTLSFGTRTRETLSDEDLSLMRAVTDHVAAAMTRVRSEEALRFSLAEKEILLKELAHRTKNNMQVIGSLIALQASGSTDETLLGALSDTQDRIRAMALVHEKLYHSGNVSSLNMNEYVRDLVSSLLHAHQGPAGPVTAELDVDDLRFSIDEALPCGLIINELVSNSVKHAFPGRRPGTAFLSLKRKDAGVELRYRDDGPGLPADIDPARVRSLGLKLVYNLAVRQLRGKMEVRRESATEFVFAFDGPARQEKA